MGNEFLVDMLKAYYRNENLIAPKDLNEMIEDAREQMLHPFLYPVYKNKEFKSVYVATSITEENFIQLQDGLSKLFNAEKIKHVFLKGSVLCKMYPDIALRTRGDIDLLIEYSDLPKVRKLFLDRGFEEVEVCEHHVAFERDGYEVEVHFRLILGVKHYVIDYFENPFKFAIKQDNYLYKLKDEEHFLFILAHLVKHLYHGAGLRFLLDFYYMLKEWKMDMDYIHARIHEFEYDTVYNNVLNALYVLTGEIVDPIMEEIDIEFFLDYLLRCGVHGFAEDNVHDNAYSPEKENKKRWFIERVFLLNKGVRIARFPHLGQYAILYPLVVILNGFRLSIKLIVFIFRKLFRVQNRNRTYAKQSDERTELNKKLGIQ